MIELITNHFVEVYIIAAIALAIAELRLDEARPKSADEAFWMMVMIAVVFPIALVRRAYIIAGKLILWVITPSNKKLRTAAEQETKSLLSKIKQSVFDTHAR